jgi:hypothetical protein
LLTRSIALAAVVATLAVLLAVSQMILPGIAASRVRSQLARNGTGVKVMVSAFPAVELLWHDADKIDVQMTSYHASNSKVSGLLQQAGGIGTLHVTIGRFSSGPLIVHDVSVKKLGKTLDGTAMMTSADLNSATRQATDGVLPSVTPVSSNPGELTLQGTATVPVVGTTVTADAIVSANDGQIVVQPRAQGILSLVTSLFGPITVFSDPKIHVDSLSGAATSGGLALSASATLQ